MLLPRLLGGSWERWCANCPAVFSHIAGISLNPRLELVSELRRGPAAALLSTHYVC